MKAEDLRLAELVEFSEGRLNLHGRRLVLHDIHAFAQLRRDLAEMVGLPQARRIFTRFGCFWGRADAAAMDRLYKWDERLEWLKAGPRMHALQGVARVVTRSLKYDPVQGHFSMEVLWHDSGEAEEHVLELGPSTEPVCWMLSGYASGYASYCLNQEIYFIETKCRAKGDKICMAAGKDVTSWGDELKPHLPFFQADEIQGKIQKLTKELRQKTKALQEERRRVEQLEREARPHPTEARSAAFRRILELADRVAPYDSPVLITGESGVGKEVLARRIREHSPRAAQSFVAVNCGALPETLLEGELFGHRAGAFTGAVRDRVGLFEEASGGTIFLDEIGDISAAMQLKLLRVLQEGEILRVGENRPRRVAVRVLAATNRDLKRAIREGGFREDLYYRLAVVEIEVPPLRERQEDILPLARTFLVRCAQKFNQPKLRFDPACVELLTRHAWPGNVRELENAVERATMLCRDGLICPEHLPVAVGRAEKPPAAKDGQDSLSRLELAHIKAVLAAEGGNRTRAAAVLGISPTTLWRRLKEPAK